MDISSLPGDTLLIVRAGDICFDYQALADRIIEKLTGPVSPVSSVSDEPLTQKQATDFLQVTRPTFTRWRKQGKIAGHVLGGRVYFFRSELVAALKTGGVSVHTATR